MTTLSVYFPQIRTQVRKLCEDNTLLRQELAATQQRLQEKEKIVIQLQEENNRLELKNSAGKNSEDALVFTLKDKQMLEKTINDDSDVATILETLALMSEGQNNHKEAKNLLKEVLAIREQILGKNHPVVADTLNKLVVVYRRCKKYKKAESLCERALHIKENILEEGHVEIVQQLTELGVICYLGGKYKKAAMLIRRALDISVEWNFNDNYVGLLGKLHSYWSVKKKNSWRSKYFTRKN